MTNLSPRELQDLEKRAEEEKKSDTSQGNISISDDETTERKLTSALSKSSINGLHQSSTFTKTSSVSKNKSGYVSRPAKGNPCTLLSRRQEKSNKV